MNIKAPHAKIVTEKTTQISNTPSLVAEHALPIQAPFFLAD